MGSGFRKGAGVTSGHPFLCAALSMINFGLGSGRECWEPTVDCCGWCWWGVGSHPLSSPWTGLEVLAGVAHSHAMWPKPWHLKHWRELVSILFKVPPWVSLDPWEFPWL